MSLVQAGVRALPHRDWLVSVAAACPYENAHLDEKELSLPGDPQGVTRRRIRTPMSAWPVPRRCSPRCPCINGARRLLAAVACYQAARSCNHPLGGVGRVAHRLAALHACMKCVAQGVTRRRIRTHGCLGGAPEVALAAHASTEALACGGGVLSSRTIVQPSPWRCGWLIDWQRCMHAWSALLRASPADGSAAMACSQAARATIPLRVKTEISHRDFRS